MEEDLDNNSSTKQAWLKARLLLGSSITPSPSTITHNQQTVTDPKAIAELFATYFDTKYKDTRAQRNMAPQVDPVKPVKNWLVYTNQEQPLFNIDTVPEATILKHLKNSKAVKHYRVMILMGSDFS